MSELSTAEPSQTFSASSSSTANVTASGTSSARADTIAGNENAATTLQVAITTNNNDSNGPSNNAAASKTIAATGGMHPMLPSVCSSSNFVLASPAQVQEYAASSVVGQLVQSLDSWLSHCEQVFSNVDGFFRAFDADERTVIVHLDLICDVAESIRRLELETSFHVHFTTDEVAAVRRVLDCVPKVAKEKLETLDKYIKKLQEENTELARSRQLFELLDAYCAKGTSWTLMNCDDTLPPLFGSLRAIFICCPLFGKTRPRRFSALVRCVAKHVEHRIVSTVPDLLLPQSVSMRSGVEDALDACLAAQSACVSMQEEFFKLRISVSGAVASEYTASIYEGIDEETFFSQLEFYYDRCVILLQLLTVLKQRADELFLTGGYAEKLLSLPLLSRAVAHEDIIDSIRSLTEAPSMKPKDIIARIESKSAEYVAAMQKRQAALVLDSETLKRKSRVGAQNESADRSWSLMYGDQQQHLAQRDPYYAIIVKFNPPHVQIAGIPLNGKQLEAISTKFQDALRARVSHTAASIRHNRLDMASINAATAVLKAPYQKFRSAAEELADARYEASGRSFNKVSSSNNNSNSNQDSSTIKRGDDFLLGTASGSAVGTSSGGGGALPSELATLRRYHVAASHCTYTLDMPDSFFEEFELQSYAELALLECFEAIDGEDAEMAAATAFTDESKVHWSYFVFRYLPSMPRSRRKRAE